MALRGKKPTTVEKRLKALFYGPAGVGKTTAAIQFPRPYLIDTERGAENPQYVAALEKAGGVYMGAAEGSTDPGEVIKEVTALLAEPHEYRTLIIDPFTVLYNDLLDKAAEEVGTDFGRHKGPANRTTKRLLNLCLRLDMNVIFTSHAKPKWVRSKDSRGKDTAVQEGITFDAYDGLDYLFDLVFEVQARGKDRIGVVRKTRVEAFPEGDLFPFNYDSIAERYGRDVLEKGVVPVVLASPAQVAQLRALLEDRKDGQQLADKWLAKAQAETLEEMSAESVTACIKFLGTRRLESVS